MSSPPRYVRTRFGPSSMRTPSRWSGISASRVGETREVRTRERAGRPHCSPACCLRMRSEEMFEEPAGSEVGDGLERARLLEEVRRAGHDLDPVLTGQMARRVAVHLEDGFV